MSRIKLVLRPLLLTALLLCGSVQAGTGSGTVTFIHLNDLHAHLTPHSDLAPAPEQGPEATRIVEHGGLARTATLIERIRAENPNSLLMNIGDTFHGGVEALYTRGNAIVDPVNLLGIDVGVPGNWDFAYGPLVTRQRFGESSGMLSLAARLMPGDPILRPDYPNLAANVRYSNGREFLPATLIKELNGIKVGFIGLSSDIVPAMSPALALGFRFTEGEAAHRALIERNAARLRTAGADLVVVMSELGIHKDHQLADSLRHGAVDVIFSAHTHEATFTPLTSDSGTLVVEAGNDGYLGRMDITLRRGRVTQRQWQLLEIGADLPEDPRLVRAVARTRAPFLADQVALTVPMPGVEQQLTQPINTVIGYTALPLDRRHALESSFNDFHTELLRNATHTELAISPGFRYGSPIPALGMELEDHNVVAGAITLEDAYRFFPVVYTLATGEIDGAGLRANLENSLTKVFSQDAFRHEGGWLAGFSGLHAELDLTRPDGQRVLRLQHADGRDILPEEMLTVTGCRRPVDDSDSLCSLPGFSNLQALLNPATQQAYTVVDFFVDALAGGQVPTEERHDLVDVSETALWPAAAFVQPLM